MSCVYYDDGKWNGDGLKIDRISNDRVVCSSSHLTDFSVLLRGNDDSSSDILIYYILSPVFIVVAFILIILIIVLFLLFPTLRVLVLEGELPGKAKKRQRAKIERAKRKTMEQYGAQL